MTMKILLPISVLLLTGQLLAGDKVDKSLDVSADGVVQIENVRGMVRIEGWNKNQVSLKGELDDMTESLVFETSGNLTTIAVKVPQRRVNRGKGSDLVILVPSKSRIEFEGVSSDIVALNVQGGIDLATVSGDVNVDEIEQQIYIASVSGDISIKDSSGNSRLATVSGDIDARMDSLEIEVSVVSGDVTLYLNEFSKLDSSAVNGDVSITGAQLDSGETNINSVNGEITLNFTQPLNARVNATTGPGGEIINDLTSDTVKTIFPNQQKLNCTVGDGNGKIVVSTVNGTIHLNGN